MVGAMFPYQNANEQAITVGIIKKNGFTLMATASDAMTGKVIEATEGEKKSKTL
jgi:hypothetical protein